ncbi:MAG: hypothetical protein GY795_30340 [Desulfobacterales bacterium]|nr:hypothetical protein [Desulfobacterales bacterium]
MMSVYKCLFCDNKVGSGEHIMLACLGGRRINRKLLCNEHDNMLSELDKLFAEAYEVINGLLCIVPDHSVHSQPKEAVFEDELTGKEYFVSGDNIKLKTPTFNEIEHLRTGLKIGFSVNKQYEADTLIHELRQKGFDVKLESQEKQSKYMIRDLRARSSFWNDDICRAYARLSLNFLAHYYPDLARKDEISPFIDYILGGSYKFTEKSLTELKNKGVPNEILNKLNPILNRQFMLKKSFLSKLRDCITPDELTKHEDLIIKYSEYIKEVKNEYVKYESDIDCLKNLPDQTFRFSHRIIISLDKDTGNVFALISLYGLFYASVYFGKLYPEQTCTICTDINPTVLTPPTDWNPNKIDNISNYLPNDFEQRLILDKAGWENFEQKIKIYFKELYQYNLDKFREECKVMVDDISTISKTPMDENEQVTKISEYLKVHKQRILRHMCYGVNDFVRTFCDDKNPELRLAIERLEITIRSDPDNPDEISQETLNCLGVVFSSFCQHVLNLSKNGELTVEKLLNLFEEGEGVYFVLKTMMSYAGLEFGVK